MASLPVLLRYISLPELRARPIRSLLMAGTVAVGVALLTAMHVATESIVGGFAQDLERLAGKADLQITFGTGETGFPEDLLSKVAADPSVAKAAALVRGQVTFEDGRRETVELFGIDILQKDVLDLYEVEVLEREKDDFTILNDPRGVFLTDVLARERGAAVGSHVKLSGVDGVHDYTVRGIVASRGLAEFLGGRLVAMYLPAAQPVAGRKGDLTASTIDQIDVQLADRSDSNQSRDRFAALVGAGYEVHTPLQRRLAGERTVEGLRATLVGMSSLALLAALFIVYASTTTMVAQRLPTMATLVSLGAGPKLLVRTIVAEAAILGALGALAGTVLGLVLAGFVGEDAAAGMGLNYSLPFEAGRVAWDPWVVLVLNPAGGVLAAACSAFVPARRLRSVTPLTLERDSGGEVRASSMRETILIAGSLGLVGGALLVRGVATGSPDSVSVGGILFIAASVLGMLPILRRGWVFVAPVLSRTSGIAGRIAGENLLRYMDRSLVTASAITLSVAIAVGAGSLVESFRASVANWYGFSGDALVSARAVTGGWLAAPIARDLEARLRNLPSVRDVQTLRVLQGQPFGGERIALVGLSDGMLATALAQGSFFSADRLEEARGILVRGEGAVVSQNFASHFGITETVSLDSLQGTIELPVVATIPDYVSDQGSVIVSRDLLATRWSDVLVNYYAVSLEAGAELGDLSREVNESLEGSSSLAVTQTRAMIEKVDGLIGQAFADIDTIKLLVLFLTAVGIADLVVSNTLSRKRELAVLRLVGLTDRQVVRTALLEGLAVTMGAAICGVFVGMVCAWLWVHYNYPVLVGYVLELNVSWGSIVISVVLAGVSAGVAAIVAGRWSLRQPALQAIRFE